MRPIVKYPDPILTTRCTEVTGAEIADRNGLCQLLEDMRQVMEAEQGIGLAANQVGVGLRIFIMKDQRGKVWEFINPVIIEKEGFQQVNEGCLSAPGAFVSVPRSQSVTVEALDRNGEVFKVMGLDLDAVCMQHEIDHLDGVFYLDKTTRNQRRAALRSLGLK